MFQGCVAQREPAENTLRSPLCNVDEVTKVFGWDTVFPFSSANLCSGHSELLQPFFLLL